MKPGNEDNPLTSGHRGQRLDGESEAATSGHHGQKWSGKLRQESEQPRPSGRLRDEKAKAPPPDGEAANNGSGAAPKDKKVLRDEKKLHKSKLRMEKTGDKLDKARGKLAKQKPRKKPGPVKKVVRTAKHQAWNYAHGKIRQVEWENVGVEAAHKAELAGEAVLRGGVRFAKHRIRTRPARQVRKWEKKNIRARADHTFRTLAKENPELNKNAFSRYWQKRSLRKEYQKQARAAKQGAKTGKKVADTAQKLFRAALLYVKRHPVVIAIFAGVFLILMLMQSCVGSGLAIANGLAGAVGGSAYLAEDVDINAAELAYTQWETDLTLEARNAPQSHPGYDEYRYSIDPTGHDPHALIAFLTAKYDDFTFAGIEPVLRDIFNQQYKLTFTRIVEVRYRTEYYTCDYGHEHSYQVAYNYYILEVELKARSFAEVIGPMLAGQDEQDRYDIYNVTKGNRQYVGSPFPFNWLPYVSCGFGWRVHPISGEADFHRAIDIAAPAGTEILAGGEGVVVLAESHSLYGLTVKVDYGGGVTARYSHCSAILVSVGQTVQAGDVIARVGSTGASTGPHLDIEVIKDGELLNPLYFVVIPS